VEKSISASSSCSSSKSSRFSAVACEVWWSSNSHESDGSFLVLEAVARVRRVTGFEMPVDGAGGAVGVFAAAAAAAWERRVIGAIVVIQCRT
jgi:hypothetical protein